MCLLSFLFFPGIDAYLGEILPVNVTQPSIDDEDEPPLPSSPPVASSSTAAGKRKASEIA